MLLSSSISIILFITLVLNIPSNVISIINNKYMTFRTPDYRKRYIYLEGKYSYSVQLVLERDASNEVNNSSNPRADSIFIVKAPEYSYYGVMAIIQSIYLRKHRHNGGGCVDFLQFEEYIEESGNTTKVTKTKTCGSLKRGDDHIESASLVGPRTFFSPNGSIRLQVHVGPETDKQMEIGAEIVFTAYTTCPGTDVGLKTLKACSTVETMSCIPSPLFCDSKIDCGFNEAFGLDEMNCFYPYLYGLIAVILIALVVLCIYGFMHWVHLKVKRDSIPHD